MDLQSLTARPGECRPADFEHYLEARGTMLDTYQHVAAVPRSYRCLVQLYLENLYRYSSEVVYKHLGPPGKLVRRSLLARTSLVPGGHAHPQDVEGKEDTAQVRLVLSYGLQGAFPKGVSNWCASLDISSGLTPC